MERSSHSLCTGQVFGSLAVELCGRVVSPEHQATGIGTDMLREYITNGDHRFLHTYTRNPSVLRMLSRVCDKMYPIDDDPLLRHLADGFESSTQRNGYHYHLNRYPRGGLFTGDDPAERRFGDSPALTDRFKPLKNKRNALVVVGEILGHQDD